MKPELKRIEAALQQAAKQYHADLISSNGSMALSSLDTDSSTGYVAHGVKAETSTRLFEMPAAPSTEVQSLFPYRNENTTLIKEPALPGFTASQESQGFVALTNSALAINLLKDLQTMVGEWVAALETVIQQIQALYEEGPIVDGWLESVNSKEAGQTEYQSFESVASPISNNQAVDSGQTTYRLCGLNEDGQIWCHPCPQEQVPDISWAIVRYQRLRNLIARKNTLESQLGLLTETLVDVHGKVAKFNE